MLVPGNGKMGASVPMNLLQKGSRGYGAEENIHIREQYLFSKNLIEITYIHLFFIQLDF